MVTNLPMPCTNVGNCNRNTCPFQHVENTKSLDVELEMALAANLEVTCAYCGAIFADVQVCQEHAFECGDDREVESVSRKKRKRTNRSLSTGSIPHRRSSRNQKPPPHLAAYELNTDNADEEVCGSKRVLIEENYMEFLMLLSWIK